ncbi:hypothetical protein [Gynuella sp.]|uniref:hypothetical protein n=1 Tax=Gynuella sp. TaxID=2969146 RepID=UPI003D0F2938
MRNILVSILIILLAGCGALALNPITNEVRNVQLKQDGSKSVTLFDSMVWYDLNQSNGILFPAGQYILEAEDDDYYYFKAPTSLEFRTFQGRQTTDSRVEEGGLFLGKSTLSLVPAGAYLSTTEGSKILVWKLGGDFMSMQGKKWEKSY